MNVSVAAKGENKRLAEAIAWLNEGLGWSYSYIGELVGDEEPITGTTIGRWKNGEVAPQPKNRSAVFKLCDLHYFLTATFDNPVDCDTWLKRFHPGFEARPIEILEEGNFDRVIGELAALESGAFF